MITNAAVVASKAVGRSPTARLPRLVSHTSEGLRLAPQVTIF